MRAITFIDTHWTSDQPDAETSTYTTHNIHKRKTSLTSAGFEPAVPATERPRIFASGGVVTGIDLIDCYGGEMLCFTFFRLYIYYFQESSVFIKGGFNA